MNIWKILGISPTSDISEIKKAYREKLKVTRPDDDKDGFMRLRDAYETALDMAQSQLYDEYEDDDDEEFTYDEYENFGYENYDDCQYMEESPENTKFIKWQQEVKVLYDDYNRRCDVAQWKKLIYDNIPYDLLYYEGCKDFIYNLVFRRTGRVYLPYDVSTFLNDFFSYSKSAIERAKIEKEGQRTLLEIMHHRFKQCENIRFDKLNPKEVSGAHIDSFFYKFDRLISDLTNLEDIKIRVEYLSERKVFYLPFECLYLYSVFNEFSPEENERKIKELEEKAAVELGEGDHIEINILKAFLKVQEGDMVSAKALLSELYMKVSTKDYYSLFMLMNCCMEAGMYFKSYMLLKQLTWLNPQGFMYEIANKIYKVMEEQYNPQSEDDLEHIEMCRMYLRSNKNMEALEAIERVSDTNSFPWEYGVAKAMCIFYKESVTVAPSLRILGWEREPEPPMEVVDAKEIFDLLENFPKERLSNIDNLEWIELKGRYLFEQRRHSECEEFCNELLEEYPVSYPILTLRGYTDFNKNTFGGYNRTKEYRDLTFVINSIPQRTENRILAAHLIAYSRWYSLVFEILDPIREELPDHYRWYQLKEKYEDNDPITFVCKVREMFEESLERTLDIPPVSKYNLLDLKSIYAYLCETASGKIISKDIDKIYKWFFKLKESKYNHPELYVEEGYLYKCLGMGNEVAAYYTEKFKNATLRERQRIAMILAFNVSVYENWDQFEPYLMESTKHSALANMAQINEDYEKEVFYREKMVENCETGIDGYQELAYAYNNLNKYEDVIRIYKMAVSRIDITGNIRNNAINCYREAAWYLRELERYDEALEQLENAKKYARSNWVLAETYYDAGLCYYYRQQKQDEKIYDEIILKEWEKSAELNYTHPFLYNELASMYKSRNMVEKRLAILEKGVRIANGDNDTMSDMYNTLVVAYASVGRNEDAYRVAMEGANKAETEYAKQQAYLDAGCIAIFVGKYEECIEMYTKAVKVIENNSNWIVPESHLVNFATVAYSLRKPVARDLYIRAAKEAGDKKDSIIRYALALRADYMTKGKVDRELAIAINNKLPTFLGEVDELEVLAALAESYSSLGEYPRAEIYMKKVLKNANAVNEVSTYIGWFHVYKGEYDKAIEIYEMNETDYEMNSLSSKTTEYKFIKELL